MPRILILKCGTTHPGVVERHGDYDDWFRARLPAEVEVCRVFAGDEAPDLRAYDGVLLTGSPLSVRDEAPWMEAVGRKALAAAAAGTPVLGVCFGHQLLGELLGGRVEQNPRGLEVGTVRVTLTEEGRKDPLFDGLPARPAVNATHRDILARPPQGATLLASNDNTDWQAFGVGDTLRCVQFHPELAAAPMARILEVRSQQGEVRPTDEGAKILENWVKNFVEPAQAIFASSGAGGGAPERPKRASSEA